VIVSCLLLFPRLLCLSLFSLFPFSPCFHAPAFPAPSPCRLCSSRSVRLFSAFPAPAAAPWPSRSDKFPGLFPAPAPAAPPAASSPCAPLPCPTPSALLNDLIASAFGLPLFTDAWRFLSLAAACCRASCCEVGPSFLAFAAAALCSAVGSAFIPSFPPLKLVRLAFTFLVNELLT